MASVISLLGDIVERIDRIEKRLDAGDKDILSIEKRLFGCITPDLEEVMYHTDLLLYKVHDLTFVGSIPTEDLYKVDRELMHVVNKLNSTKDMEGYE